MTNPFISEEDFLILAQEVLKILGYNINFLDSQKSNMLKNTRYCDIIAQKNQKEYYIECKIIPNGAINFFKNYPERKKVDILLVPFKRELENLFLATKYCENQSYDLQIWDIYDLQKMLENEYLKTYSYNAEVIKEIFNKLNYFSNEFYNINLVSNIRNTTSVEKLRNWFNCLVSSKKRNKWREFEDFTKEFIEYYFQGIAGRPLPQKTTDDNLHRYDFVAPIAVEKTDSYFMEIVRNCFNTRYLVFEAKCYSSKISQDEIWRTSKYLYKTALRNVAIILATTSCDSHAKAIQKSLLREQGKLILVLTDKDIKRLLDNENIGIETILKKKLDELMIPLNA